MKVEETEDGLRYTLSPQERALKNETIEVQHAIFKKNLAAFMNVMIALLIGWLVFSLIAGWPTDDTDKSAWERSGVKLVRDYGTGCQYLQTTQGSLTPRLDADGKQKGCHQ